MCGIVGVLNHNNLNINASQAIDVSLHRLSKRGPDFQSHFVNDKVIFGHARLSIIDTSPDSNQPFWDESKRYCLVFNGEIFNFKTIKQELISQGINFRTNSDTEVLLNLLILKGEDALKELNGFFAFCFYDKLSETSVVARDRYGIKPLLYSVVGKSLIYASELKAILPFIEKKKVDLQSLKYFFKFNYIPAPMCILENVKKLNPGELIRVVKDEISFHTYYQLNSYDTKFQGNYNEAKKQVYNLLEDAIQMRMIADVPLGSFLSGGIDSSIVSTIAAKHSPHLNTFSIGFKDEPFYDETKYAQIVAKKIGSNHTVFSLANSDLLEHYQEALDYFDEPFADSSALNMFILSKKTRDKVTVALSGDGADELFSGYNKHEALWEADQGGFRNSMIKSVGTSLVKVLSKSRDSRIGDFSRKIDKFSSGLKLSSRERYIEWASFMGESELTSLTKGKLTIGSEMGFLNHDIISFNDYLRNDFQLVLQGDMLRKVDAMSMANSLEVRTPFLDYRLVDLVFSMPAEFKIDKGNRKKILKEAFKDELPPEIFQRGKHGFEVPLKKWFSNELKQTLKDKVFNEDLIRSQGFLEWSSVKQIEEKLFSNNPGEAVYNTWALLSFQNWLSKYYYD